MRKIYLSILWGAREGGTIGYSHFNRDRLLQNSSQFLDEIMIRAFKVQFKIYACWRRGRERQRPRILLCAAPRTRSSHHSTLRSCPFQQQAAQSSKFAVSDSVAALDMAAVQNGRQPGGLRMESSVDSQESRWVQYNGRQWQQCICFVQICSKNKQTK